MVDTGDEWAPLFLRLDPTLGDEGVVPWFATYVALAADRAGAGAGSRAAADRFAKLWGSPPSRAALQRRLKDDFAHACHAAVDDAGLDAVVPPLGAAVLGHPGRCARRIAALRRRGDAGPLFAAIRAEFEALVAVDGAARAALAHLVCHGALRPPAPRVGFGPRGHARAAFQRREALPVTPGLLDDDTRARLALPSRERGLRERAADAAGLIEDGSAGHAQALVVGRPFDPATVRAPLLPERLEAGAPDVLGATTDAVARGLGLVDAATAAATLRALPRGRVAVPRSPPPPWHAPGMELRVEIDRGNVDHRGLWRPGGRRPALVAFARSAAGEVPLVRSPTTTGGAQRKGSTDGVVVAAKPSPRGDFV
ncbi:MAG: hypothetical protein FJ137_16615 [Deltaproteobacteria bacterium]|nr:hypothetical protein [Deltaproteobacteria bacterium]